MANVVNFKEFKFPSHSGLCDIYAKKMYIEGKEHSNNLKGIVQIAHGMTEYCSRYDEFAKRLCDAGYVVFTNDHLGHGLSIKSEDELGYFGKNDGYKSIVEDCKTLTDMAKKEYPELPVYLFGHSMGSFVARLYTTKYGDQIDGAIYMGTAGKNPAAGVGLKLASIIAAVKGDMHRSKLITKIAFGSYNSRTEKRTQYDWLTTDKTVVDRYVADDMCGFMFTAAGYKDLMKFIIAINEPSWYEAVPKDLPMFILAGKEDPVGNYGKGPTEVYDKLKESGHSDVNLKLYDGDRHELHNEKDKKQVMSDIVNWLNHLN